MPAAMPAMKGSRSGQLVKHGLTGKMVSKRSKTGDPQCSQAMSDWKTSGMTTAIAAILGKCRAMAGASRRGVMQRAAGNEAKAQVLEHRARTGKVGAARGPEAVAAAKARLAAERLKRGRKAPPLPGADKAAAEHQREEGRVTFERWMDTREGRREIRPPAGTPAQREQNRAAFEKFLGTSAGRRVIKLEPRTPVQREASRATAEAIQARYEAETGARHATTPEARDVLFRQAGEKYKAAQEKLRAARAEGKAVGSAAPVLSKSAAETGNSRDLPDFGDMVMMPDGKIGVMRGGGGLGSGRVRVEDEKGNKTWASRSELKRVQPVTSQEKGKAADGGRSSQATTGREAARSERIKRLGSNLPESSVEKVRARRAAVLRGQRAAGKASAPPAGAPKAAVAPAPASVSIHDRVKHAFEAADAANKGTDFVKVSEIHKRLPDVPLPELHAAINDLRRSEELTATNHEGLIGRLADEDRAAALTQRGTGPEGKEYLPYLSRHKNYKPPAPGRTAAPVASASRAAAGAPKAAALAPADFAARATKAAASVGSEGRFGPNKVFIHKAHEAFLREPSNPRLSLEEFKGHLVTANRLRHLDLSGADLVEAMKPEEVAKASTSGVGANFHFIRSEPAASKPVRKRAQHVAESLAALREARAKGEIPRGRGGVSKAAFKLGGHQLAGKIHLAGEAAVPLLATDLTGKAIPIDLTAMRRAQRRALGAELVRIRR